MNSIYSQELLQRIVDHWGIGSIKEIINLQRVGSNIWRHFIATSKGNFELYSYPTETREYSGKKLYEYLKEGRGKLFKNIVHSFERYHILLQLSQKHSVTSKEISSPLIKLIKSKLVHAFRVYGTIMQIEFENKNTVVTYAHWKVIHTNRGKSSALADSLLDTKDQLDEVLKSITKEQPSILRYAIEHSCFTLFLSNNISIQFMKSDSFPALEIHIPKFNNGIVIFDENEIFYTKDIPDKINPNIVFP